MSRFTGPQHRGAGHDDRREHRLEAEARDDVTPADRRRPNPTPPERDCE
jgi:hypothetical protein